MASLIYSGFESIRSRGVEYLRFKKQGFAGLVADLRKPTTFIETDKKESLPLFSPAEYADTRIRRIASNVLAVHFLVFDMDAGPWDMQEKALQWIMQEYNCMIYSSFNHDPEGQHKFRVLVELSKAVHIRDWHKFFPRAVAFFGLHEKDPTTGKTLTDMACKDPCRAYFQPGGDREKYVEVVCLENRPLNVNEVLDSQLPEGMDEGPSYEVKDVLDEDERGEITPSIKSAWNRKLRQLADDIVAAPYPGPYYELKSHRVYGLARGVPHIISEEKLRTTVRKAIDERYQKNKVGPEFHGLQARSYDHVDAAIAQGKELPWYPERSENTISSHPLTEGGLRLRLLDRHCQDIAHEFTWKAWLVWTGKFWNMEAGAGLVLELVFQIVLQLREEMDAFAKDLYLAQQTLQRLEADPGAEVELKAKAELDEKILIKQIDKLNDFWERAQTNKVVSAAVSLARHDQRIMVSHDKFNRNPYLLNFHNGIVDLRTGELSEHDREEYLTRIIPHEFVPGDHPVFTKVLDDVFCKDAQLADYFLQLVGYSALGLTTEQKLIMCIGDGANGKSTLFNLLLHLFGTGERGYGIAVQSENILSSSGSQQHATWRMSFFGKRLALCQEVDEGRTFNESLIKELTGGDMITGRKMRQDEWSYTPTHTLWLAANHLPKVRGIDEGIWRRLEVIPFRASFRGMAADPKLLDKLKAESGAIWATISRYAARYLQEGLGPRPQAVEDATTEYREEQDPFKPFFDARCDITDPTAWTSREALWKSYTIYCEETRERTFYNQKSFTGGMRKKYKEAKRHGHRGFYGIRLLTNKERQAKSAHAVVAAELKKQQEESEEKKSTTN
jgi:putative DNA primase/helicase